jgi:DNA-binding SARP family transcriptional activator
MDLQLLGPIEVRLDDQPLLIGARKQRAVLAMLGLQVGQTVSADHLADGLWGERAPPSAPKLVQLYVSHLRRSLSGNGAQIVTRGRGYELQLSDGEVDAVRFEQLLEQTRAHEALALWRGPPLSDVADEPFAAAEIRRLEELRGHAAEMAIDDDLAAGRHGDVIADLDALVARHPLHEHLQAQRMLALYRAGRQAEALESYRRARTLLVGEIGVEPGPELRHLHAAILAQDPALDCASRRPLSPATYARGTLAS